MSDDKDLWESMQQDLKDHRNPSDSQNKKDEEDQISWDVLYYKSRDYLKNNFKLVLIISLLVLWELANHIDYLKNSDFMKNIESLEESIIKMLINPYKMQLALPYIVLAYIIWRVANSGGKKQ
jgi:hypothetical protein